jgi:Tfp pilus assembly PilM family ATPase
LSPEAIVDGSIMDSSLVVEAISRLLASTGVKGQNVAVSVSGHSVIVKKILLPMMPEEELSESIRWEAEQYVPFDINDVYLDYVVLDPGVGRRWPSSSSPPSGEGGRLQKRRDAGRTDSSLVDVDVFALRTA